MSTLEPKFIEHALRALISDLDYDIHKSIDSDDEDSDTTYDDLVNDFIVAYEDAEESTPPPPGGEWDNGDPVHTRIVPEHLEVEPNPNGANWISHPADELFLLAGSEPTA